MLRKRKEFFNEIRTERLNAIKAVKLLLEDEKFINARNATLELEKALAGKVIEVNSLDSDTFRHEFTVLSTELKLLKGIIGVCNVVPDAKEETGE